MKKAIVVAGNGPSLARIDYRRLPEDFDVFRCNQFYFEEKYYLGKRVKGAFIHAWLAREQYFTLKKLEEREEYSFDEMYYFLNVPKFEFQFEETFEANFPRLKSTFPYLAALPKLHELSSYLEVYYQKRFTAGINTLISAVGMGYREIYLAGMDFYRGGGGDYAFDTLKPNLVAANRDFIMREKSPLHGEEVDVMAIREIQKIPGVQLYSICEQTALNEYIPLAPVMNKSPMRAQDKPEHAIRDFYPLPSSVSRAHKSPFQDQFRRWGLSKQYERLRKVIYVRLVWDFFVLVRITIQIFGKLLFRGRAKKK